VSRGSPRSTEQPAGDESHCPPRMALGVISCPAVSCPGCGASVVRPQPRGTQANVVFWCLHPLRKAPLFFTSFRPPGSLLPCHRCACAFGGVQGHEAALGPLADLGSGLPSLPPGLPMGQQDRAFQHQTGRDSLGMEREVFSPLQAGMSPQKMAKGLLPGAGQEGGQQHPAARTPRL